jgi:hypothetical protein
VTKKTSSSDENEETAGHQSSILFYEVDDKVIDAVTMKALKSGLRLTLAQVVRMLVRKADLANLTQEDLEEAAKQSDRRRTEKKKP